jgi:hypothetical protein
MPVRFRRLLPANERRPDVADDLEDAIRTNADGPAEAHGDAGGMKQHSLPDQIAADKYLAGKRAAANPAKGFTRLKIVPPGTC